MSVMFGLSQSCSSYVGCCHHVNHVWIVAIMSIMFGLSPSCQLCLDCRHHVSHAWIVAIMSIMFRIICISGNIKVHPNKGGTQLLTYALTSNALVKPPLKGIKLQLPLLHMLKYLIATSRLKISKLQMYLKTLLSSIRDQSMYWNSK